MRLSAAPFRVSHLALYPQPNTADVRGLLLGQDMIWVAGGSLANLLAVWHAHDLAPSWRNAGTPACLTGVSAGSVCWFTGGTTDSFGLPLREVRNGLVSAYSNSAHHDAEEQRRPAITKLIAQQRLPECYATDNGAFGTAFHEAVSDTPGAQAWHLTRNDDGTVREEPLPTRLLPDPDTSP